MLDGKANHLTSLPAKLLLTILMVGFLLGEALLWKTMHLADGRPALSVRDLQISFTGGYDNQLENKIYGTMRPYLPSVKALDEIHEWIVHGATKSEFDHSIMPILKNSCMGCHRHGGKASFRPLTNYEQLLEMVNHPPAPSLPEQLNFTKIHIVTIGLLLFVISYLFFQADVPCWCKYLLSATAYGGLLIDFASWWAMHWSLEFAYGRALGHALLALSTLSMGIITLIKSGRHPSQAVS